MIGLPSGSNKPFPAQSKLHEFHYSAISEDNSIKRRVRSDVLHQLEESDDQDTLFSRFRENEILKNEQKEIENTEFVGHAMTEMQFELGIVNGYFGAPARTAKRTSVRKQIDVLISETRKSTMSGLLFFKGMLFDSNELNIDETHVCWYFESEGKTELNEIHSDLALRLALSNVDKPTRSIDFVVFQIPVQNIAIDKKVRQPRFVDVSQLSGLFYWRPGGFTAPWINGLAGLPELVATGTCLAYSTTAIHFLSCDARERA